MCDIWICDTNICPIHAASSMCSIPFLPLQNTIHYCETLSTLFIKHQWKEEVTLDIWSISMSPSQLVYIFWETYLKNLISGFQS